jgi:hypothetical protein
MEEHGQVGGRVAARRGTLTAKQAVAGNLAALGGAVPHLAR